MKINKMKLCKTKMRHRQKAAYAHTTARTGTLCLMIIVGKIV